MQTWQSVSHRTVYSRFGRGIDEVTYRLPDGRLEVFSIQTQPPSVSVLALTTDQEIIVTRQFRPGPNRIVYELPGGYLSDDESPVSAGERELREETGYQAASSYVAGSCIVDSYSTGIKYSVVSVGCQYAGLQVLGSEEFIEVLLLPVQEFKQKLLRNIFVDLDCAYLGLELISQL